MSSVKTTLPVIPSPQTDRDVKTALNNLRNFFTVLAKNGGVMSAADLIGTGLVDNNFIPTGPLYDGSIPPAVQNFTATGAFRTIMLSWDALAYNPARLAYYEIWRSTTNNMGTATAIGSTTATVYVDTPSNASLSITYYYWVRAVSVANVYGPFNNAAGTPGSTANDPAYLLQVLTAQISATQLAGSLSNRIDKIDLPTTGLADQMNNLSSTLLSFSPKLDSWLTAMNRERAISDATVNIDPTTGAISLKATAAITANIEARISTAEYNINAANNSIQSNTTNLTAQGTRLTAAETNISQQGSTLALKASTAYVDAKAAETVAILGPGAENTVALSQKMPEGLMWLATLSNSLGNASRISKANIAQAQFDIKSNADAITAEATARLALATRVDGHDAAILSEQTARSNADTAEATARLALATRVTTAEAAIVTEQTARANGDSANASSITTLQTTVNGNTASIQTQQTSINGINAQYTIKLDVNGKVAGIGLMNAGTTSNFIAKVDNFAIAGTGATDVYPFIVSSGVTYLKAAMIQDATITNAKVASLATDKLYAGSALIGSALIADASITTAKIAATIQSDNWAAGTAGWYIGKNGDSQFRNIYARGDVEATSVKAGSVNIIDTLMLQGNAVTFPVHYTSNVQTALNGTWQNILALLYTIPVNQPHGVILTATMNAGITAQWVNDQCTMRISRYTGGVLAASSYVAVSGGEVTINISSGQIYFAFASTATCVFYDEPGVGTHEYRIEACTSYGSAGMAYERSLVGLGAKR